jgi:UDP-glucuronate decarboxylase
VTILVTGAAGFLGRHLVRSLLADGQRVLGVDNFITSDPLDLLDLRSEPRFSFLEMDAGDPGFLVLASSQRIDGIYHLACPTGVPNLGPLALEMWQTCYRASEIVLQVARANRAPVLLTSTAEVYGNPEVSPQAESYTGNVDTLGPRKGYEEGKRVAETLFAIYAERYQVDAKIVRVFNTYGPGMALSDTRIVPAAVSSALQDLPITVYGDGSQTRCHVYVDDMINGLRLAMAHGQPARAYNIGSQSPTTVKGLVKAILRHTDSTSPIEFRERPGHDHDLRMPDTMRAQTELGWTPSIDLEEGLTATVEDFRRRLNATGHSTLQVRRSKRSRTSRPAIAAAGM